MNNHDETDGSVKNFLMPEEILACEEKGTDFKVSKRVTLNVGGSKHEVLWKTLEKYPNSRLGQISLAKNIEDVKELCDDLNLFDNEIFFERNSNSFDSILNMYRTGKMHEFDKICANAFNDDLAYWGLKECLLEDCCQSSDEQNFAENIEEKIVTHDLDTQINEHIVKHPIFGDMVFSRFDLFKKKLWLIMSYPTCSSWPAKVMMIISVFFVILSTTSIVFSTLPEFKTSFYIALFDYIELICIGWFTIEFLLRFISSPNKLLFVFDILNLIDLVSILPYYGSMIFSSKYFNSARKILSLLKTLRIVAVFKLARHSIGLRSLGHTFKRCYEELRLLIMLFVIGMLVFSTLVYYAEMEEPNNNFPSIPAAMWWSLVTLTTVGYGDMVPTSALGKLVAGLCCICGVFVIALPIPIIVSSFTESYRMKKIYQKSIRTKLSSVQSARSSMRKMKFANYFKVHKSSPITCHKYSISSKVDSCA